MYDAGTADVADVIGVSRLCTSLASTPQHLKTKYGIILARL